MDYFMVHMVIILLLIVILGATGKSYGTGAVRPFLGDCG